MASDNNNRVKVSVGTLLLVISMFCSVIFAIGGSFWRVSINVEREIATILPTVSANTKSIDRNAKDISENRTDIKQWSRKQ